MRLSLLAFPLLALGFSAPSPLSAQTQNQAIYSDALQNDWQSWGWAKTIDFNNATPTHAGAASIRVGAGGWDAVHLHHAAFNDSSFGSFSFWVYGGPGGGQKLRVQASRSDKIQDPSFVLDTLKPNEWKRIVVTMDALSITGKTDVTGLVVANNSPDAAPDFFLDDVELLSPAATQLALSASATPTPTPTVAPPKNIVPIEVSVDASANRHPISPLIYGVNFGDKTDMALKPTLNRWGGNSTSRYNWQQNSHAIGADYFFESVPDGDATPGGAVDALIQASKDIGAAPMVTIPMSGWVGDVGPNRDKRPSYSVKKYGPQQKTEQWVPDAGNGVKPDGTKITDNDPTDANMAVTPDFQAAWVKHLVEKWGGADKGGVRYYLLDNEPGLWHVNHRDVVKLAPTAAQMRDRIIAYARALKAADPGAKVVGTEEWGWNGYIYSPADVQFSETAGWNPDNFPDRKAIGGQDFQPWLLGQIRAEENRSGQKLLDVFTVHIYPQQNGIGLSDTSDTLDIQHLRNRSTRTLWDPNYKDESWINQNVAMIPRMKKWVADNAPGLPIGITEYNWGNDGTMNGADAQADVLGIFGREGLDMATRWVAPTVKTPTFAAMQIYRNYDGKGSGFGDTSIKTDAPNPDVLSAFGAVRNTDGALTTIVIHKESGQIARLRLKLTGFVSGKIAQHFAVTGDGTISRLPDLRIASGVITCSLPPQSINLFVVPKG